jgi:dipeptide/tripeptide permease
MQESTMTAPKEMIKKASVKYPIAYMATYLAVQMFLIYNIVLFATHVCGLSLEFANNLYAVVWGLGNIVPILVIKFSDRWGYRESLIVAGIFQTLGFAILSFPSVNHLLIGCAMYGTGMILAVAQNYVVMSQTMRNEYRGRFNVFLLSYALMNGSAFIAGIISGFANDIGYVVLFRIGAVVSAVLLVFVLTLYKKAECFSDSQAYQLELREKSVKRRSFLKLLLLGVAVTVMLWGFEKIANITSLLIDAALVGTLIYLCFLIATHKGKERVKIAAFTFISVMSMVFWTGYNLYTGTAYVDILDTAAVLHGFSVQWVLDTDPLVIIAFGLLIAVALMKLSKKGYTFNALLRLTIGLLFLAAGMGMIVLGFSAGDYQKIDVFWVIGAIALCGFGEIFIGPVNTAVAGQCATKKLEGVFISIGFLVMGGTGAFSAAISNWMLNINAHATIQEKTHQMSHVIGSFGLIALASAIVMMIVYKPLTRKTGFNQFYKKPEHAHDVA